jgi:hypothetical protein
LLSATSCAQRWSANAAVDASEQKMAMDKTQADRSEHCWIITEFHLDATTRDANRDADES